MTRLHLSILSLSNVNGQNANVEISTSGLHLLAPTSRRQSWLVCDTRLMLLIMQDCLSPSLEPSSPATRLNANANVDELCDQFEHGLQRLKLSQSYTSELIDKLVVTKSEYLALEEVRACLLSEDDYLASESQRVRDELSRIDWDDPRTSHIGLALADAAAGYIVDVLPRHKVQWRVLRASIDACCAGRRMVLGKVKESSKLTAKIVAGTISPLSKELGKVRVS